MITNHCSDSSGDFFRIESDAVLRQILSKAIDLDSLDLFAQGVYLDYNELKTGAEEALAFCENFLSESKLGFDFYPSPFLAKACRGLSGDWTTCIGLKRDLLTVENGVLTWDAVRHDCAFYVMCVDSAFWVGFFRYSDFVRDAFSLCGVTQVPVADFEKWKDD